MEQKNLCTECRYYAAHFIKIGASFRKTCVGHCVNGKLPLRESHKRIQRNLPCEFWEPAEIQLNARRKSIEENITFMSERLDEIAQILKDDCTK